MDFQHALSNLFLFGFFGVILEIKYGTFRLFGLWLIAVIGGNLAACALTAPCILVWFTSKHIPNNYPYYRVTCNEVCYALLCNDVLSFSPQNTRVIIQHFTHCNMDLLEKER